MSVSVLMRPAVCGDVCLAAGARLGRNSSSI